MKGICVFNFDVFQNLLTIISTFIGIVKTFADLFEMWKKRNHKHV